jgi:glycosyltransferase involved in cell wall biosynthesis
MRIVFLSVSAGLGGAERVLLDSVAALRTRHPQWTLSVVCLAEGPLTGELAAEGADVCVLPLPARFAAVGESGRSAAATVAGLAGSAWALQSYTRRLHAHLWAWRPDVVHANGLEAHVLAAWASPRSARIVWHVHDYVSTRRVSSVLLRRHVHRAALVVANSHDVAADVRTVLGAQVRVEVVHNGIDTQRFHPTGQTIDLDAAAGLPPAPAGTARVGLVATYARWKGHETFLRALAGVAAAGSVRGYVVGGPVYETSGSQFTRDELAYIARGLGLGDRVGFVPFQRDVAPAYRALDIVVHASTKPEPFGLSVLEAMACGRPVIVSEAGGVRELVTSDEQGLTHPPGDVNALANRLALLLDDPARRERLGAAGRRTAVALFDRARSAGALADVYLSLCPAPAGADVGSGHGVSAL